MCSAILRDEFNEARTIRVMVIDGQSGFKQGLINVFESRSDVEMMGTSESMGEAISGMKITTPNVVVLDPDTVRNGGPSMNGTRSPFVERVLEIKKEIPDAAVAVVTSNNSSNALRDAVVAGARGYMLKDDSPNELMEAIVEVAHGGAALSRKLPSVAFSVIDDLNSRANHGNEPLLTKREIDVLNLVALGKTNRQIARELYIADNTVKNHVRNILEKLGVHTRMEAVERASSAGLLS
jgi:DNA-binding NarL/FixJ family response regulator